MAQINATAARKPMELVQVELPAPVARRGISEAQWRTLSNNLFPGAKAESVLMVWDYCVARRLDPLKKPCHIVPMQVKVGDNYEWRDVVMPGIYELRTTAQRTGEYLGHSKPTYGPTDEFAGVVAPEWCDFTVYRWNPIAGVKAEFPVTVFFAEVVATKNDGKANARWSKAPTQMLTKCAEAAALREAFPDEIGGEQTAEEMDGQRAIDITPTKVTVPAPEGFDEWLTLLRGKADDGWSALEAFFGDDALSKPAHREYLTRQDTATWEALKQRASAVPADAEVPANA